ncbi:MAG: MazG nucleotide pyrophosphohydrolase domain-containing protein [Candidatus Aenigmatarchaeota archaeon]
MIATFGGAHQNRYGSTIAMTTISEITNFQRKFDESHGWNWRTGNKIDGLMHGVVCLTGEIGEFANALKKVVRHEERGLPAEELWAAMREELTDVFIYLIKLADLLGMELDKEYFAKMAKNAGRFEKFQIERTSDVKGQANSLVGEGEDRAEES